MRKHYLTQRGDFTCSFRTALYKNKSYGLHLISLKTNFRKLRRNELILQKRGSLSPGINHLQEVNPIQMGNEHLYMFH
jgi:hypothetical protein